MAGRGLDLDQHAIGRISYRTAGAFSGDPTRLALRHPHLASQPGFAAVAILSLALGSGDTAIFSLINSVLLSALPVRDPHSL